MSLSAVAKHRTPVIKLNQPDDSLNTKPLPLPTGVYPYHLTLPAKLVHENDQLTFHMVGDTGSLKHYEFQRKVAAEMSRQYEAAVGTPSFLYHLGDVVYNFGEAEGYPLQFFGPFEHYPAPVFAIAGNHDSDVNPDAAVPYHSLEAFMRVFCDTEPRPVPFSNGKWLSNTQPNAYWTLETPLANIIGMHTNTPKYGFVSREQQAWLHNELLTTGQHKDKALLICLHHAPYSADANHSSSLAMIRSLNEAFDATGVIPDAVFSGHVHNYQRFNRVFPDGKTVSFIVAGAGGYDTLHTIASVDDAGYSPESDLFDKIELQNYCDNRHGFLKINLQRTSEGIKLNGEYYTIPHDPYTTEPAVLTDAFQIKCR